MTCKEVCIHCDVCPRANYDEYGSEEILACDCPNFKPKSRFVELPCEVGDYLLWDNGKEVVLKKVKGFRYDPLDLGLRFIIDCCTPVLGCDAIKGILSREDAEKALAERSK